VSKDKKLDILIKDPTKSWSPGWPEPPLNPYPIKQKKTYKSSLSSYDDYSDEKSSISPAKINTAINYTIGIHSRKNDKEILDETGSMTITFMIQEVVVKNRVRFVDNYSGLIDDKDGDWFVVKIRFNPSFPSASQLNEYIVYNFKKNNYFALQQKKGTTIINGEKTLAYSVKPYSLNKVSEMDLLEWLMVRKAIYLEKFDFKTNIKDIYDPTVLSLNSFAIERATIKDIKNSVSDIDEYDLLDLED